MGNRKAPTPAPTTATDDRLLRFAAAFTEWDRRYREDPEGFENEASRLLKGTPETYGDAAAPYFIAILDRQDRLHTRHHPTIGRPDNPG